MMTAKSLMLGQKQEREIPHENAVRDDDEKINAKAKKQTKKTQIPHLHRVRDDSVHTVFGMTA
jgi:hypothetical protein